MRLRMLGKGIRVQDSKCCAVVTVRHVADRLFWLSWPLFSARWAPFVVSPVERQVESLSRRHHQRDRGRSGAGIEPLACVHSIRGGATRWLWSRTRRSFFFCVSRAPAPLCLLYPGSSSPALAPHP